MTPDDEASSPETLDDPLDVVVDSPLWAAMPDADAVVRRAVAAALPRAFRDAELCVLLADDAAVRALNARYRGRDSATNVLSFPALRDGVPNAASSGLPVPLGDVVIAYETVRAEADSEGKPLAHHLSHLVVHGVLHLLGHDHETDAEADAMEAQERAILATLAVPDPYAGRDCA
ncbi:Metal-dependent hydrolase YbeY, involved in rRNA and/or ribosome maturation and assembly [Rhodovulum sp. PH10]|uniref:rRNA maturation RNase YbeY n=1 Tax=Rhodovulum sp. PH10 TaxID=1187851 RepID=UPI00027C2819|nr:rRNA maturation RNase YbeY [Rhodovulum sp. PH10]EJW10720.1 Metal-dependent hydrolase YbeY, involved in rRNA and/or ribosome maturation and assembly [Rhodovulum sp. PH10]